MTEIKLPSRLERAAFRKLSIKLVRAGEHQARCVCGIQTFVKFHLMLAQVCGLVQRFLS